MPQYLVNEFCLKLNTKFKEELDRQQKREDELIGKSKVNEQCTTNEISKKENKKDIFKLIDKLLSFSEITVIDYPILAFQDESVSELKQYKKNV